MIPTEREKRNFVILKNGVGVYDRDMSVLETVRLHLMMLNCDGPMRGTKTFHCHFMYFTVRVLRKI